ncbi:FAD-binding oxidoreductase [Halioxenophilus sp. WMMB6]|uniref:FAD-binding oxidoreductase n=1 Tax=Halioxenophilus sp. WMMB6 TaxID=3073815 RepID=UPI00295E4DC4|nr:FAD-binding oxidoreductase [Halioxenophilus sp. WMMB6]
MGNTTTGLDWSEQNAPTQELLVKVTEIVGGENCLTGSDGAYFYTDVYRSLEQPLAVVRPTSVEQLQQLAKLTADEGVALTVRGGGASYTDGYIPNQKGLLLIDLSGLDKIVEINEQDGYVTVEAGVTWATLKETLAQRGYRTPFWGPFSGLKATVGGSMSQNSISHGSGAYGISAQSALAMDVVLADGSLLQTGSAAAGSTPFARHYGPDLTGLFTGDCGALAIKARITLALIRIRPSHRTISFAFPDFTSMHESMRRIAQERLEDTHFALDGALSQGQIARQENAGQIFKIAFSILANSPSLFDGFKQLIKSALSARKALSSSAYMTHYIVEGVHDAEAKSRLHRLRELNQDLGREIPATVPATVRGMPFAPFFNTLGPAGERWVPLHGILPHSKVNAFHDALTEFYKVRASDMERLGVWQGGMFGAVGSSGFLYEIALYWPDEITVYHQQVIPKDYLDKLPKYEANEEARNYVEQLKKDLIALFVEHGAINFQLGRAYPYGSRISPEALKLITSIKNSVDPTGRIAPGALEL